MTNLPSEKHFKQMNETLRLRLEEGRAALENVINLSVTEKLDQTLLTELIVESNDQRKRMKEIKDYIVSCKSSAKKSKNSSLFPLLESIEKKAKELEGISEVIFQNSSVLIKQEKIH